MLQRFNPKNATIRVYVDEIVWPREQAEISVFDRVVQGRDAVWEGLRVYAGGIFCPQQHLDRLKASARALAFQCIPDKPAIGNAISAILAPNGMQDEMHIRLTLTRGEKITSGMDPRLSTRGSRLSAPAEGKPLVDDNKAKGRVISSSQRRNNPQFPDPPLITSTFSIASWRKYRPIFQGCLESSCLIMWVLFPNLMMQTSL